MIQKEQYAPSINRMSLYTHGTPDMSNSITNKRILSIQVCLTNSLNRETLVAFMRTAVTLGGNADKLVFTPDISANNTTAKFAEMCGEAIVSEG